MSGCPHLKGPLHDFDKAKEQKLEKCKGGTLVPLTQIMIEPEKLFTGPAFKSGHYIVNGASQPALDALQNSVDDHLGMDSRLTCENKISLDHVELSFTEKDICHHDKAAVILLEPEEEGLSEIQKVMLTKIYALIDMTEHTAEGYSRMKKTELVDQWA